MASCFGTNNGQIFNQFVFNDDGTVEGRFNDNITNSSYGNLTPITDPTRLPSDCCTSLGYDYDFNTGKCYYKNPCDDNDGVKVLFGIDQNDAAYFSVADNETSTLEIKLDYLFGYDCNKLLTCANEKEDSITQSISNLELDIADYQTTISGYTNHLDALLDAPIQDGVAIQETKDVITLLEESIVELSGSVTTLEAELSEIQGKPISTILSDFNATLVIDKVSGTTSTPVYETVATYPLLEIADFQDYLLTVFTNQGSTGLSMSGNDCDALYNAMKLELGEDCDLVNDETFNSNWLRVDINVIDTAILDLIKNENIHISVQIEEVKCDMNILLDRIEVNKITTTTETDEVFVSKCPGFNLTRVLDNKKSWTRTTELENRTFDLVTRETDYDLSDSKLVINTKEMDLNVDPSGAIECNVHEYVKKNLECLLTPYTGTTVVVATSRIENRFPPASTTVADVGFGTDPYDSYSDENSMFYIKNLPSPYPWWTGDNIYSVISNEYIFLSNSTLTTNGGKRAVQYYNGLSLIGSEYELDQSTNYNLAQFAIDIEDDFKSRNPGIDITVEPTAEIAHFVTGLGIRLQFKITYFGDEATINALNQIHRISVVPKTPLTFPDPIQAIVPNGTYGLSPSPGYSWGAVTTNNVTTTDFGSLLTTELSGTTKENFIDAVVSELIDAKTRKILGGYPTLVKLYEIYLGLVASHCPESNRLNYKDLDSFIDLLGSYWIDLIEQFVPATTLWGATNTYRNTAFHQNKFRYSPNTIDWGCSGTTTSSGIISGDTMSEILATGGYSLKKYSGAYPTPTLPLETDSDDLLDAVGNIITPAHNFTLSTGTPSEIFIPVNLLNKYGVWLDGLLPDVQGVLEFEMSIPTNTGYDTPNVHDLLLSINGNYIVEIDGIKIIENNSTIANHNTTRVIPVALSGIHKVKVMFKNASTPTQPLDGKAFSFSVYGSNVVAGGAATLQYQPFSSALPSSYADLEQYEVFNLTSLIGSTTVIASSEPNLATSVDAQVKVYSLDPSKTCGTVDVNPETYDTLCLRKVDYGAEYYGSFIIDDV